MAARTRERGREVSVQHVPDEYTLLARTLTIGYNRAGHHPSEVRLLADSPPIERQLSGLVPFSGDGLGGRVDISVIVPVYKEEENIRPFLARVVPILEAIGSYEVIFCLDPSPDRTEAIIRQEAQLNP